jgi:hypothetical protein
MTQSLLAQYDSLRARLQLSLAQPEKDLPAVDALVDELESLQLRIKREFGIKGNNPNE